MMLLDTVWNWNMLEQFPVCKGDLWIGHNNYNNLYRPLWQKLIAAPGFCYMHPFLALLKMGRNAYKSVILQHLKKQLLTMSLSAVSSVVEVQGFLVQFKGTAQAKELLRSHGSCKSSQKSWIWRNLARSMGRRWVIHFLFAFSWSTVIGCRLHPWQDGQGEGTYTHTHTHSNLLQPASPHLSLGWMDTLVHASGYCPCDSLAHSTNREGRGSENNVKQCPQLPQTDHY